MLFVNPKNLLKFNYFLKKLVFLYKTIDNTTNLCYTYSILNKEIKKVKNRGKNICLKIQSQKLHH